MITWLEDTLDVINETLELIKDEAELKGDETQIEIARCLEQINDDLNKIYAWLRKEF